MKLDLSKVQFSKYDFNHNIRVPSKLTKELAYFSGVHFGDGNLGNYRKHYYSVEYSGHLIDEYEFYTIYFANLFKDLFNKDLRLYEIKRIQGDYLTLCTQSKAIFTFLSKSVGLPIGHKNNQPLPEVVLQSKFSKDFLRGLADADFCMTFKKRNKNLHYYPVISLKSSSNLMVSQINDLLKNFNFKTYTLFDYPGKRYNKIHVGHYVEINGVDQLEFWMKKIGFKSRKHITKYLVWQKFGFCPPYTNLPQRELILKGELDHYSFYKNAPKSL